jgi:hypothetical protein
MLVSHSHTQGNDIDHKALYAKFKANASNPHYKYAKAPDRSEPRKHPTGKLNPTFHRKDGIPHDGRPGREPTAEERQKMEGAVAKLRSRSSLFGRK